MAGIDPDKQPPAEPCDHNWKWIHDSVGDSDVVNGTQSFSYRECQICGAEDNDTPFEHQPQDDDVI